VDPLTHGLASYALKRGFFPRSPRATTFAMILAGVIADADWVSYYFGPSSFLTWHRTYTHSLVGSLAIAVAVTLLPIFLMIVSASAGPIVGFRLEVKNSEHPQDDKRSLIRRGIFQFFFILFIASLLSSLLHLALDTCQGLGAEIFWPFRTTRVALDWLPNFDLSIFIILLAAIFLPELFRLVSLEIGTKSNRPRGRSAALIGFAIVFCYTGARAVLHSSAIGMLQSREYADESPRRVAAFPDSLSLFSWHGVIETASALHTLDFSVAPGAFFDPESAVTVHKPDPSAILNAAQNTVAAQMFLKVARFPRATVLPETKGYSVELRDLRYAALDQTVGAIQVEINLDLAGKVTFARLEWQKMKPRY
jgi:membrane-bound metal-dependent hydrolase YbcI (DUF457 family)